MAGNKNERAPLVRDVAVSTAQFVENCASLPLTANVLLRGPRLTGMTYEQLGCPRTIINLRQEVDDLSNLNDGRLVHFHCPMGNKYNVYDTPSPQVRTWLANVFRHLETAVELPIYIHCKQGRDRTGVVVGILLLILGFPKTAIMQDFLLTDGANMVDMQRTLDGVRANGGVDKYFEGMLDLEAIRRQLSLTHIQTIQRQFSREALQAIKRNECPRSSCMSLLEACQCGLKLIQEDVEMHARLGWALTRLGRQDEGHAAFSKGLHLATSCNTDPEVVKLMKRELEAIEASAAVDAYAGTSQQQPVAS